MSCCQNVKNGFQSAIRMCVDEVMDVDERSSLPFFKRDSLQKWGYVPGVSLGSGALRVAKHAALLFPDIVHELINRGIKCATFIREKEAWKIPIVVVLTPLFVGANIVYNVANIARGIIETVPFVGNGFCCAYDTRGPDQEDRMETPFIKEDGLQEIGHKPLFSTGSGAFRVVSRVAALVYDAITIPIAGLIGCGVEAYRGNPKEGFKILFLYVPLATLTATTSNVINIARGIIEMVPFVGNGFCVAWDKGGPSQYRRIHSPFIEKDGLRELGYEALFSTGSGAYRVMTRVMALFYDTITIPVGGICDSAYFAYHKKPKEACKELFITMPKELLKANTSNIVNIARGIIEMVPFAGNGLCYSFDKNVETISNWYKPPQQEQAEIESSVDDDEYGCSFTRCRQR